MDHWQYHYRRVTHLNRSISHAISPVWFQHCTIINIAYKNQYKTRNTRQTFPTQFTNMNIGKVPELKSPLESHIPKPYSLSRVLITWVSHVGWKVGPHCDALTPPCQPLPPRRLKRNGRRLLTTHGLCPISSSSVSQAEVLHRSPPTHLLRCIIRNFYLKSTGICIRVIICLLARGMRDPLSPHPLHGC